MPARAAPPPSPTARAAALLAGPDAGDVLAVAFAGAGAEVTRWRVRQVAPQRGGATASYSVRVRWPDGTTSDELVGARAGRDVPDGVLQLSDGLDRVGVWRLADDPDLPGLRLATNPTAVADLLERLGVGAGPVAITVRAYRPRRRAVVEATGATGRLFVKVVRPHEAAALHDRHRLLADHGLPVPPSLGWSDDGLVVLGAIEGPTLRDALRAGAGAVPEGDAIVALLDRLPPELAHGTPRPSWLARVGGYAETVARVTPAVAGRVRAVAAALTAQAGHGPVVPTHGDLYETQLLVDGDRITGLLDLDGAGPGDRLDDLGGVLGHLAVLARVEPAVAATAEALAARYLASFERTVPAADLRYRTAAVIVALATGPHRVQQPRWEEATADLVGLAERWVADARSAGGSPRESDLTPISRAAPGPASG